MKPNTVHNEKWPLLRLEAALAFAISVAAYALASASWLAFAALFLAPDVSMLGYLRSPRWGALIYNLGHTYTTPLLLAGGVWLWHRDMPSPLWLIWLAHIAFDRMLGFGLKQAAGFHFTHLGVHAKPAHTRA